MTDTEGQIYLEPREFLDKAIIGVHEGKNVYELNALIKNYALHFIESAAELGQELTSDVYDMAAEFIDYNTIPALPYMGEYAPLVVSLIEDGFEDELSEDVDVLSMNDLLWEILC